ncbi:uncharacterized protein RHOBADRAFT_51873 [Rhodotorula graminis WP1]|uniref:Amine oxidase domain-containing protein n=1 Tax=Rhodotorula graminis (strain WP1) TaxID=578459 RepID=A0A194S831_RHOGW|nr:uncharacterized protein RHOBADRAFT_51873 [Rhodotorula graminis WP1]KPV76888.1 hypothetical protein RHOBADRAFT_51873 [Rhodotorula graminis WP1]
MASTQALYDALIIGSGMAGLAAARELSRAHLRVLLLEARHRTGGRIHTTRVQSQPVDLGGSMVHGFREGNPVAALITRDLDLDVHIPQGAKGLVVGAQGPLAEADATSLLATSSQNAFAPAAGTSPDASIASLLLPTLQRDPRLVALARTAEIGAGTRLEDQAAQYAGFEQGFKGTDAFPLNGYGEIADTLVADVKAGGGQVRLGAEVTSVEDLGEGNGVRVSTRDGDSYTARAVISTIPHAVLQQSPPTFSPPLSPAFLSAIERMRTGTLEKVVLSYPSAWWPSPAETGSFLLLPLSDEPASSAQTLADVFERTVIPVASFERIGATPHPTLLAYVGAAAAQVIARYSVDEVAAAFHEYLVRRLSPSSSPPPPSSVDAASAAAPSPPSTSAPAPPAPTTTHVTTWLRDPFSLGATSAPTPLTSSSDGTRASPLDFHIVSRPTWGGRLGWAGEHTDVDQHGSVAGAFISGRREGRRVCEALEG